MSQANDEQGPDASEAGPSDVRSTRQTSTAADLVEATADPERLVRAGATSEADPYVHSDTAPHPPQSAGDIPADVAGPSDARRAQSSAPDLPNVRTADTLPTLGSALEGAAAPPVVGVNPDVPSAVPVRSSEPKDDLLVPAGMSTADIVRLVPAALQGPIRVALEKAANSERPGKEGSVVSADRHLTVKVGGQAPAVAPGGLFAHTARPGLVPKAASVARQLELPATPHPVVANVSVMQSASGMQAGGPTRQASSESQENSERSGTLHPAVEAVMASRTFSESLWNVAHTAAENLLAQPTATELLVSQFFDSPTFTNRLKDLATDVVLRVLYERNVRESTPSHQAGSQGTASVRDDPPSRAPSPSPTERSVSTMTTASMGRQVKSDRVSSTRSVGSSRREGVTPLDDPANERSEVKRTSRRDRRHSRARDSSSSDRTSNGDRDSYVSVDIKHLKPFVPTNELFVDACDFRTYRLNNKNGRYSDSDRRNIRHMRKDIDMQMRTRTFDGSKPITILTFLKEFQDSCNTNNVHEGAARWLVRKYLHGAAQTLFDSTVTGRKNSSKRLDTYCDVVHFLLRTYARNEAIAKAHQDVASFRQDRSHATEEEFAQALLLKANACGPVYPEKKLISYFVEGCGTQVRSSVRTHLAANPSVDLMELATYARTFGDLVRSSRDGGDKNKDQDKVKEKKSKHGGQVASVSESRGGGRQKKKGQQGQSGRSGNTQQPSEAPPSASSDTTSTMTAPTPAAAVFAVHDNHSGVTSVGSSSSGRTAYAPSQPPAFRTRSPSPGRSNQVVCRICLCFGHDQQNCPHLTPEQAAALHRLREENVHKLRSSGYYERSRSRELSASPGRGAYSYSTRSPLPRGTSAHTQAPKNE